MLCVGHAGTLTDQPSEMEKKFQGWISLLFDIASEEYE